ncbi:2Fe-2S iron-sulfur cluster-binding protein [Tsukamurella soli]|uniref:2Fe-2S iron-sulfur cluster-binding protein n=1 Tax=Tsukamurella soli TaxID=644556 RepID=A0ABP8JRX1_9ACTN
MPCITYLHPDGRRDEIAVDAGTTVMRAAVGNGIEGIVGECGGQAMCATCHVYIDSDIELPRACEDEEEMLECTAAERLANSRLGCQLRAGEHFDALVVRLPERQV